MKKEITIQPGSIYINNKNKHKYIVTSTGINTTDNLNTPMLAYTRYDNPDIYNMYYRTLDEFQIKFTLHLLAK